VEGNPLFITKRRDRAADSCCLSQTHLELCGFPSFFEHLVPGRPLGCGSAEAINCFASSPRMRAGTGPFPIACSGRELRSDRTEFYITQDLGKCDSDSGQE
jgi:hypothetical protein